MIKENFLFFHLQFITRSILDPATNRNPDPPKQFFIWKVGKTGKEKVSPNESFSRRRYDIVHQLGQRGDRNKNMCAKKYKKWREKRKWKVGVLTR